MFEFKIISLRMVYANNWRPARKSGLTPETTEGENRILCNHSRVNPLFLAGLHIVFRLIYLQQNDTLFMSQEYTKIKLKNLVGFS